MSWQQSYLDRYYSPAAGWVDGTTEFHRLCESVVPPGGDMLEVGAGPSNKTSDFLKTLGRLQGIDIDPAVRSNRALVEAHVLTGDRFPFEDGAFDACVSNYVIEHVADPLTHLLEINRVLKPGGTYAFRAPNLYHYVALVSATTPHWFHKLIANRLRNMPVESHDPYPTKYRLNSRSKVKSIAAAADFEVEHLSLIEKEPMYGLGSRPMFLAFMAYERLVNSSERFANLRANLLVVLRKKV